MKLTGMLNTLWFRRSTIAVLAYAMALSSISATKQSDATSETTTAVQAASEAKAVGSDNTTVELIHTIVTHPAAPATPEIKLPKVRTVMMQVTAYCPCKKCCGPKAQGLTASGKDVSYNAGRFVAADRSMAFGTKLIIPGYHDGNAVEVIDRGGAIKGNKLDVFFPTHAEALKWGRQNVLVTIVD